MSALIEALRRKYDSPQDVLAALGLDASLLGNEEKGNNMAQEVTRDRGRARDYARGRARGEEEDDRELRDALRRAADSAEIDPEDAEIILEGLAAQGEGDPEIAGRLGQLARELGEDRRGAAAWARDRRERRRLGRDRLLAHRPRKFGRDNPPPFNGMPETGGGMYRREEAPIDRFAADGLAYDAGSPPNAAAWLGPQAAAITRTGSIR
jgi:hypothetical protein